MLEKISKPDRRAKASETLKDHTYTVLVDQADVKAWRCKAVGTNAYAFDILMSVFGIAVVGDIDNLTFEVGLGYGIAFLAGDDIDYYIHSKLSPRCKETEFDRDAFLHAVIEGSCEWAAENICGDDYADLPEWIREGDGGLSIAGRWDELREFVTEKIASSDGHELASQDAWADLDELLGEAEQVEHEEQAHEFMAENSDALCAPTRSTFPSRARA